MSGREFPALGFDPAPGDAGAVTSAAHAAANRVANCESQIPEPTYENYTGGW